MSDSTSLRMAAKRKRNSDDPRTPAPQKKHKDDATTLTSDVEDLGRQELLSKANAQLMAIFDEKAEQNLQQVVNALRRHTENGYKKATDLITKHGITFDQIDGQSVLHRWAIGLLKKGSGSSDVPAFHDEQHQRTVLTPLWNALCQHRVERYVNVLDDKTGNGPLHFAFGWGTNIAVQLLLSLEETNINLVSTKGLTPLMHGLPHLCGCDSCNGCDLACYFDVMKYYYAKIDLSIRNPSGQTLDAMIQALPTSNGQHAPHVKLKARWNQFLKWINTTFYPFLGKDLARYCALPNELVNLTLSYLH
jgi:hypothetical protein